MFEKDDQIIEIGLIESMMTRAPIIATQDTWSAIRES